MLDGKTYTQPDKWYSLTKECEIISSGNDREGVTSSDAYYYVRREYDYCHESAKCIFPYYKYHIYDKGFEVTNLSYNGVVCESIKDILMRYTVTSYKIKDKFGDTQSQTFSQGVESLNEAYLFLKKLDKCGGWKNYEVLLENESLKKKVSNLEIVVKDRDVLFEENKRLKEELNKFLAVKTSIKQLFEGEI